MSNRSPKLIPMALFLGMIAVATHYAERETVQSLDRMPSSTQNSKDQVLKPFHGPDLHYTRKVHGPIATRLELVGTPPTGLGDVFVLRGTIESEEDLENIAVNWRVPEGIEILEGQLSDTLPKLAAGQPVIYELTLKNLMPMNLRVHFVASSHKAGADFADGAQYNTLDQEEIDHETKKLAERNAKQMLEDQLELQRRVKVMH